MKKSHKFLQGSIVLKNITPIVYQIVINDTQIVQELAQISF